MASLPQSHSLRWRLDKTDRHLFTQFSSTVHPLAEFTTCDEAATYFTDALRSAALHSIPRTWSPFPRRPVSWWNIDCIMAVRDKRAAFSLQRQNRGDLQCLEAFPRTLAWVRRILKEAQRDSLNLKSLRSLITLNFLKFLTGSVRLLGSFQCLTRQFYHMLGRRWRALRVLPTCSLSTLLVYQGRTLMQQVHSKD